MCFVAGRYVTGMNLSGPMSDRDRSSVVREVKRVKPSQLRMTQLKSGGAYGAAIDRCNRCKTILRSHWGRQLMRARR